MGDVLQPFAELAYLAEPTWLCIGIDQDRGDFLVLPSSDFTSWLKAEARYADSVACGRVNFQRMRNNVGQALFHTPLSLRFWYEQSDRCGMMSSMRNGSKSLAAGQAA